MSKLKVPITRYEIGVLIKCVVYWNEFDMAPEQKACATRLYKHLSEAAAVMAASWKKTRVQQGA